MIEKHKLFCLEYLKNGLNATKAYSAIYKSKCEKTARSNGHKLLKRTDISSYIKEELEKQKQEKIADIDEILISLTSILRNESREQASIFIGEGKQEIVEKDVNIKERNKAAELLMKYYNIGNKQELKVSGDREILILDTIQKLKEEKDLNDEYEE